jgi:LysM repeat protein
MSEGGYFPWRVQKLQIPPHMEPKDFCRALPVPPVGMFWQKLDDRTWDLVAHSVTEVKADQESESVIFPNSSVLVHTVMQSDTIQGLALRYRVPVSELRRFNFLPNNNVQVLKVIKIPISHGQHVVLQSVTDRDVILQQFKNETGESREEARAYLEEHDYSLRAALEHWREDEVYEQARLAADLTARSSAVSLTPEEQAVEDLQRNAQLPFVTPHRVIFVDCGEIELSSSVHVFNSSTI